MLKSNLLVNVNKINMKIKILSFIMIVLFSQKILGQPIPTLPVPHCNANVNKITTDWRSDEPKNKWDWTTEYFDDVFIVAQERNAIS
jgi:hypothetical protein